MTTLYIAGPMSNLPDFNYPAFHEAEAALADFGYTVLSPAKNRAPISPREWDWYMRQALPMVCQADGLALLPNWHRSRGARLEYQVALALGMERRYVADWTVSK